MRNRLHLLLVALVCGFLANPVVIAHAGFEPIETNKDEAVLAEEKARLDEERAARVAALNEAIDLFHGAALVGMPGLAEPLIDHAKLPPPLASCALGRAPRTHAILVGVGDVGLKRMSPLEGPANDLELLGSLLPTLGVDPKRVHVLLGKAADRAGLRRAMLEVLEEVQCGDRVLVHFSTLGLKPVDFIGQAMASDEFKAKLEALEGEYHSYDEIVRAVAQEDIEIAPAMRFFFDNVFAPDSGDLALMLSDDSDPFNEVVLGRDVSDYMIAVRNRGAHAIASLDTIHAKASRIEERQKYAAEGDTWSYEFGAEDGVPAQSSGLGLVPGHGDFAVFYASGSEEMTPELKLPRGDPDARVYGLFSFQFASALASGSTPTPRSMSRVIESAYRGESEYRDRDWLRVHPRIEASNADLVLIAEAASPQSGESPIRILSPAPTRGVMKLEKQEIDIEGLVDWPVRTLGVSIDQQPVEVDAKGRFRGKVQLKNGMNRISVNAVTADSRLHPYTLEFLYEGDRKALEGEGRRYAVIIANQNYGDATGFNPLSTPFADAEALAELLVSKYGFETSLKTAAGAVVPLVLKDPTKREIEIALHHVGKTVSEKDTVLVFFAGHGIFEPLTSIAYWVPSDAEAGFEPSYLSAADISAAIQRIQSGNVILISDSCYSGALLRGGPATGEKVDEAERTQVMLKLQSRRSRIVITSGNNEPVQDLGGQGHSVFARALLTGLEEMEHDAFSARELFDGYILQQVSANADQEPQYRPLEKVGHEGGDFVFVKVPKG